MSLVWLKWSQRLFKNIANESLEWYVLWQILYDWVILSKLNQLEISFKINLVIK